jgi:hypothetical protein
MVDDRLLGQYASVAQGAAACYQLWRNLSTVTCIVLAVLRPYLRVTLCGGSLPTHCFLRAKRKVTPVMSGPLQQLSVLHAPHEARVLAALQVYAAGCTGEP